MEIKEPKAFEVNDKAHADLFNDMVKVLLENDTGLLEQLLKHTNDGRVHASEEEKKKWNDSQIYKITADNGMQLINVSPDSKIFDAIKDKGTCTFYAASGVQDSPSSSNTSLRGMQIVGQNNIGAGFAVDIAGNAYSFYYNSGHTTITWTPLPSKEDLNKWNGSQLIKITNDTGGVRVSVGATESLFDKITQTGKTFGTFYSPSGVQDNPSALSARGFYHFTSADSNNKGTFGWVIAVDYRNNVFTNYLDLNLGWQGWRRLISDADFENVQWLNVTLDNGSSIGDRPVQYVKWGNLLLLRGHLVANREVICGKIPITGLPDKGIVVSVPVSGTTGHSKLYIYKTGELKLTGLHAVNNSGVTGYYLDTVVPLN
ncbi:hypothetical protein [Bacillus safensis]|uniref:hypothetical protein n=1 Tax=Bacillus safensis TaxID=561879 RepID=UPI0024992C95|nr:hypothetical protein [Bacillus safensis]GMG79823.1 hypothetical protein ShirakiTA10_27850 [Bacillus safensis]